MNTGLFRDEPVLITGGAGFIGSHLSSRLVDLGARVRVYDNLSTGKRENLAQCAERVEFLLGDLRDADAVRKACRGTRYVFHQAALGSVPRSIHDPAMSIAVNVSGTANLLAAARDEHVERVVWASSSSVYGDSTISPKREGEEGRPLSPYALSKRMCEELAELFWRCFRLRATGLRYFNVYGPRQDPDGPYAAVVPRFIRACESGQPPVIYGDGLQSRDFTFVTDVVAANLLAAAAPEEAAGRCFNIGAGQTTTVMHLAQLISALTGNKASPQYEPARPGDVPFSRADTDLAERMLGFRASIDVESGLRLIMAQTTPTGGVAH